MEVPKLKIKQKTVALAIKSAESIFPKDKVSSYLKVSFNDICL